MCLTQGGLCEWEKTFATEHWLLFSHQRQQQEVELLVSQHTWRSRKQVWLGYLRLKHPPETDNDVCVWGGGGLGFCVLEEVGQETQADQKVN